MTFNFNSSGSTAKVRWRNAFGIMKWSKAAAWNKEGQKSPSKKRRIRAFFGAEPFCTHFLCQPLLREVPNKDRSSSRNRTERLTDKIAALSKTPVFENALAALQSNGPERTHALFSVVIDDFLDLAVAHVHLCHAAQDVLLRGQILSDVPDRGVVLFQFFLEQILQIKQRFIAGNFRNISTWK